MAVDRQTFSTRLRFGKWAGFVLGTPAIVLDHQIATNVIYAACPPASTAFVLVLGSICASIGLAGAFISWWTRQQLPREDTSSASLRVDRFIATLSVGFALLGVLFILFATTAGLLLRCEG